MHLGQQKACISNQCIHISLLQPKCPDLKSQLLSIIWMATGKCKYLPTHILNFCLFSKFTKAFFQKHKKIIISNLIQFHQITKMIERGFLLFKYFLHHRLLATQKYIVYMAVQLKYGTHFFIQILIQCLYLLKFI